MLRDLKNDGIIPAEKVIEEINNKKIFQTELSEDEIPEIETIEYNNQEETDKPLQALKNVGDDFKLKTEAVK